MAWRDEHCMRQHHFSEEGYQSAGPHFQAHGTVMHLKTLAPHLYRRMEETNLRCRVEFAHERYPSSTVFSTEPLLNTKKMN
jgi:hypothetical protein